jgi:hypothetical protein
LTACSRTFQSRARPFAALGALALLAVLPGCAALEQAPANPFAGGWSNAESQQISFRPDTLVARPNGGTETAMGAEACGGTFRFGYGRKSRGVLLQLTPHQPDLRTRLASMLPQPEYPVAELVCGTGVNTFILLDQANLVVVHRDGDIAAIERMSRAQTRL